MWFNMKWITFLVIFSFLAQKVGSTATLTPGIECERVCAVNDEPKICYYRFYVELYTTLNAACSTCRPNATNYVVNDCECVIADGVERSFIAVNRMLPGPAIYVCKGDKVVVDVTNHLEGESTTIHWHGVHQHGTQFYDGVPHVTQCPILPRTIFRYQWNADKPGTYFWHSHTGLQHYAAGSLIIRDSADPQAHLYDFDIWQHTIILHDWQHLQAEDYWPGNIYNHTGQDPDNILINGRGSYQFVNGGKTSPNYAYFNVTSGYRYRFRMINAFVSACAPEFAIEGHNITLIAVDGNPVQPVTAATITSLTGQRFDFVVDASQKSGSYWIQIRGTGSCGARSIQQLAILHYDGSLESPESKEPSYGQTVNQGRTINPLDRQCNDNTRMNAVCLSQLNNTDEKSINILSAPANATLYFSFEISAITDIANFFRPQSYDKFFVLAGGIPNVVFSSAVNNISFVSPSSPLLSQLNDIDPAGICDARTCKDSFCTCSHLEKVPLGGVIDIVIGQVVNTTAAPSGYHPFHFHGHSFYLLASGTAEDLNVDKLSMKVIKQALDSGLIQLRSSDLQNGFPPQIDTVPVPSNGFAILRLIADNPGFWLLHCHVGSHAVSGMDVVLQVGEEDDFPAVPFGFPRCGNFVPDIDSKL